MVSNLYTLANEIIPTKEFSYCNNALSYNGLSAGDFTGSDLLTNGTYAKQFCAGMF
jgi:hypothetical protein